MRIEWFPKRPMCKIGVLISKRVPRILKEQYAELCDFSSATKLGKPAEEHVEDIEYLLAKCENTSLKKIEDIRMFKSFQNFVQAEVDSYTRKKCQEIDKPWGLMNEMDVIILKTYIKVLNEKMDHHTRGTLDLPKMALDLARYPAKEVFKQLERILKGSKNNLVFYKRCTMIHYHDLKSSLLPFRAKPISRPIPGKAPDRIKTSQISLERDEEVIITETTDQRRWVVRKAEGTEAFLPSV